MVIWKYITVEGERMKSFGIVYKAVGGEDFNEEVDLHINLWDLAKKKKWKKTKKKETYIDFGLKINYYKKLETIEFYFPFGVKKENIHDLYDQMKNRDTAALIFNDNDFILNQDKVVVYKLSDEEKKRVLVKIDDSFQIDNKENYSILKIDVSKIALESGSNLENAYIRFRVKSEELKKILWLQSKLGNKYFESAFVSKQIIDLKINEPRNIEEIYKKRCRSNNLHYFKFRKIHFLLAEPASGVSTFFGKSDVTCRTLEDSEWDTYLENTYNTNDALVYHIKSIAEDKKYEQTFKCLIKSEIKETNLKMILAYMMVVIVLGAIGSGVCNGIGSLFSNILELMK